MTALSTQAQAYSKRYSSSSSSTPAFSKALRTSAHLPGFSSLASMRSLIRLRVMSMLIPEWSSSMRLRYAEAAASMWPLSSSLARSMNSLISLSAHSVIVMAISPFPCPQIAHKREFMGLRRLFFPSLPLRAPGARPRSAAGSRPRVRGPRFAAVRSLRSAPRRAGRCPRDAPTEGSEWGLSFR